MTILFMPVSWFLRGSLRFCFCIAIALLLQSCSSAPARIRYYDFGQPAQPADNASGTDRCRLAPIYLADVASPDMLNSDLMQYRLLYLNDQQSNTYAGYRWSMPPAQLLKQRIKAQLTSNGVTLINNGVLGEMNKRPAMHLRVELTDFSQYFSDASHSYSRLQLRASLTQGRMLLAQTTLQQQANAPTANAPGGAQAMRMATDQLILELNQWLCKQAQP